LSDVSGVGEKMQLKPKKSRSADAAPAMLAARNARMDMTDPLSVVDHEGDRFVGRDRVATPYGGPVVTGR
jgi:hypothetical protein